MKKLLLVMEMNQTLVYINNRKAAYVNFSPALRDIAYHDSYQNFDFLYRPGKVELINYIFQVNKQAFDVAVWSNLDSQLLGPLCQKYFGRYYRQLLFVLGTNRALYTKSSTQRQDTLKIRKQLGNIFTKWGSYSDQNTLVFSNEQNLCQEFMRNNVTLPAYSPKMAKFEFDVGSFTLKKYLMGVSKQFQNKSYSDIRTITDSRNSNFLFERYLHSTHSPKIYR